MGLISRLLRMFSGSRTGGRGRRRRPVSRRGSTAGGLMGAVRGLLRGRRGRTRI